jgi:hypothetical protein
MPGEGYATDKSQLGPLAKRSRAAEEGWIKRRKGEAAKAGERLKASQLKAEQKTGGKAPKAGQKAPKAPKAGSKTGQQAVARGEERGTESPNNGNVESEKPQRDAKGVFIVKNKGGVKSRAKAPPPEPAVDPKSVNRGKKRSRPVSAEYEEEVIRPSLCNTANAAL